ncbi:MAG: putative oxidoreductase [Naasia sp.]|jgi:aryl-alcohol dehydrogenase-like predicted oxidoreductase|uniref:aldo/keto reductase n=1 Tax=Naasia sp. TaxID=2546198 RepID=UPI00261A8B09|nr:aldo/keto reductase [Naasia sp.]MCU1571234.1 putative oxidoreductase [Naasia sp.]
MRAVPLGRSGIDVSEFLFGAGGIGGVGASPATRGKGLTLKQGIERLDEAWDLGIRGIDTANSYAGGASEEAVGRWLDERQPEDALIATKVGAPVERGQDGVDLSARHIERQLTASVRRLGRVDLYLSHAPDPGTPLAETLGAFAAALGMGIIRAYGCSNVTPWDLEAMLTTADREGLPRPEWVQNSFSLLVRGDERDLLPLVMGEGLGYTPYSPLAGGILSDRYLGGVQPPPGSRLALAPALYSKVFTDGALERVAGLGSIARDFDVSTPGLALAWLRWHPQVTAPIVSPHWSGQWDAVHEALGLDLPDEDATRIGELFD